MLHCVTHTGEVCPTLSHLLRTNTHRGSGSKEEGEREREGLGGSPLLTLGAERRAISWTFPISRIGTRYCRAAGGATWLDSGRSPNDVLLAL